MIGRQLTFSVFEAAIVYETNNNKSKSKTLIQWHPSLETSLKTRGGCW